MNQTEGEYVWQMIPAINGIVSWAFESVKLLIGKRCTYIPDFLIEFDDHWEVHEIKGGHIWEDSKIKFKAAATMYMEFRINGKPITGFEMWQWKGNQWKLLIEIRRENADQ